MSILVTGAAGFVGCEVALRLLDSNERVIGLDSLNPYYDVRLKKARLRRLQGHARFRFERVDLADTRAAARVFKRHSIDRVIHLAAQPGVRHSLNHPAAYIDANLVAFANVLEQCRHHKVAHLVFASSSSVYGANTRLPYSVRDNVDHPLSLYAATKKANELMAHSYAHLFKLPVTGLRLFTVYGPWGRPDMAPFTFLGNILAGRTIHLNNHGKMRRDFTFIDDVADVVVRVLGHVPAGSARWSGYRPDPAASAAPYRIYNVGNRTPVGLLRFVQLLEQAAGRRARTRLRGPQPGEVMATFADTRDLVRAIGAVPVTPIEAGIPRFVDWYRAYYRV